MGVGGWGGLNLVFLLGTEAENHHVPIKMNGFFKTADSVVSHSTAHSVC